MRSRARGRLTSGQAVALGLLQGPTELMPVSSSAHITLVPWLAGSAYGGLDEELRKAFEVALHAGTVAALLVVLRDEVRETVMTLDGRRLCVLAAASGPPAAVGYAFEGPIERRLGAPAPIAAGVTLGALALGLADLTPQRRHHWQAGVTDGLWLGIAQACALVPGVSRNGATLTAARLRGFVRPDANRLSRHVALPVILGATGLKLLRLQRRGLPPGAALPLTAGVLAAFASTLACRRVIGQVERNRSLAPYALYRLALAAAVAGRLHRHRH